MSAEDLRLPTEAEASLERLPQGVVVPVALPPVTAKRTREAKRRGIEAAAVRRAAGADNGVDLEEQAVDAVATRRRKTREEVAAGAVAARKTVTPRRRRSGKIAPRARKARRKREIAESAGEGSADVAEDPRTAAIEAEPSRKAEEVGGAVGQGVGRPRAETTRAVDGARLAREAAREAPLYRITASMGAATTGLIWRNSS